MSLTVAVLDFTLIYFAFSLAYFARYSVHIGAGTGEIVPFAQYQGVALLLLGIMMPVLLAKGAYRTRMSTEIVDESVTIFSSATMTVATILVVTYMLHHFEFSRALIIYMWVLLIVLLILGRALCRGVQRMFHRRGFGTRKLLVVGASDCGKMIMQSVMNRPDLGYEVVGFVDRRSHTRVPDFGRFQRMGLLDDIPRLIETKEIDEVIVALPGSAYEEVHTVVRFCEGSGVGLKLVPDLFRVSMDRINVDDLAGIPLLDVQAPPHRRVERSLKRALDLLIAGTATLLSLPVIGFLALLVKLDSRGPAFIRQERIAQGGKRFTCFKLRTMNIGADRILLELRDMNETIGPTFKMRNDPRVTNIGRFIRRYSLDEVPQLWNVVRGEMSLVGPRPPLQHEVEQYEPWQRRRLQAKPGMTGLWQVSGRSNLTFDEMVVMDIMYIDNWSLSLDFKIILQTFGAVLAARGAY
jgi:exopolysaccharide biosynthesis polyprenyl glycosylphosphotransferase